MVTRTCKLGSGLDHCTLDQDFDKGFKQALKDLSFFLLTMIRSRMAGLALPVLKVLMVSAITCTAFFIRVSCAPIPAGGNDMKYE